MNSKARVFIDGSWLWHCFTDYRNIAGNEDFVLDFKKLKFLIQFYLNLLSDEKIDVVETHYFGSIPVNKPGYDSSGQKKFYEFLKNGCQIETEIYNLDFRNDPDFRPKEKCVDVALTTSMMYYAFKENPYDIGVILTGDLDYLPLLKTLKKVGKKILLVAIDEIGSGVPTNRFLLDNYDYYDFPPLFLNDFFDYLNREFINKTKICNNCGYEEKMLSDKPIFICVDCEEDGYEVSSELCIICGNHPKFDLLDSSNCSLCHRLIEKIYDIVDKRVDEYNKKTSYVG